MEFQAKWIVAVLVLLFVVGAMKFGAVTVEQYRASMTKVAQ